MMTPSTMYSGFLAAARRVDSTWDHAATPRLRTGTAARRPRCWRPHLPCTASADSTRERKLRASTRFTVNGTFTASVASWRTGDDVASEQVNVVAEHESTLVRGRQGIALLAGLNPIARTRTTTGWPRTRAPGTTACTVRRIGDEPSRSSSMTTYGARIGSPRSEVIVRGPRHLGPSGPRAGDTSASAATPAKSKPTTIWSIGTSLVNWDLWG